MTNNKRLVVMSDDFGMCPAVNEGIVQAFVEGILTDSNLMAPCPSFDEAAKLTKQHNIPVGIHSTFTCDWDKYFWGPLTEASSLITKKNYFKDSVPEAWDQADLEEAWIELLAQYDRIVSNGITLTHVGEHMGIDPNDKHNKVMARLVEAKGIPHKGQLQKHNREPYLSYKYKSNFSAYSSADYETIKAHIKDVLFSLEPGDHMWVVHCGIDDGSLSKLCSPDFHARIWADTFRINDLRLCLDPDIKNWINENEIELTSITEIPTAIL
ncbi:MAG: hypothetical protein COA79_18400 [Planctomycetota bacterium]|nr:MAG: hypothetical protein COA79_18400 [Planctomycetota bacterium]